MPYHEFKIRTSKIQLGFYFAIILISIIIYPILPIIIAYIAYSYWHQHSLEAIWRTPEGKWLLKTRQQVYEGEIQGSSTVTAFVSILRFKVAGKLLNKSYIIFRDALANDEYRKLMVILRMY